MSSRGNGARNKGANAEREVAELIRKHGLEARRGFVFCRESDIVGLDGFHIEVKRQESYRLDEWMEQSIKDAAKRDEGIPIVVFRKSRKPWRVLIDFEQFLELVKEVKDGQKQFHSNERPT